MSQSYSDWDAASPGAVLVARREALNMSVTDVARHLKLSLAQVEALEAGAYERLPGRVFVRGFLINYAKLLDIDAKPLLHTIDHEMPQASMVDEAPQSTKAVMPREESARWPTYLAIAAAVIVGLLAVYEFGFNEPPPANTQAPEAKAESTDAASAVGGAPAAATEAKGIKLTPDSLVSQAPDAPVPQPAAGASEAAAAPSTPAAGEPATTAAPVLTVPAGQRLLHFRFEQDSWVEVRDRSDKIIFAKLNKPGSSERVIGTPPFKLVVGNARGVRLDYDDTPVDLAPPQASVSTARLTLQ